MSIGALMHTVLGDGARSTKFDVAFQFTNPSLFPSAADVACMVKSTSFPAKSHTPMEFKYKGRNIPIRGQIKYSNTWECTFYVPENHSLKKAFENWIEALDEVVKFEENSDANPTRAMHARNSYVKDIAIYQLGYNNTDQVTKYTLFNVFPIEIAPITVAMEGPGQVEELTVTFSYSHFKLENTKGQRGQFLETLSSGIAGIASDVINEGIDFVAGGIDSLLSGAGEVLSGSGDTWLGGVINEGLEEMENIVNGVDPVAEAKYALSDMLGGIGDYANSLMKQGTNTIKGILK